MKTMNAFLMETQSQSSQAFFEEKEIDLLDRSKIPHHIAIIMDGNRRWAKRHGLPVMIGHGKGVATLIKIVQAAKELGVKVLTVYAFSTENWHRSPFEVEALMHLFKNYLRSHREDMMRNGVRLDTIGDLHRLPQDLLEELHLSKEATKGCDAIDLILALNYGGRDDICRATKAILEDYSNGKLANLDVTEAVFANYLDTARWRDPELFIRTSGEKRLSNFLLWQLSYSEVYITDILWPDFDSKELFHAILDFQQRNRRWGS